MNSIVLEREQILKESKIKSYSGIHQNKYPLNIRKQRGYQLEMISSSTFNPFKIMKDSVKAI